MKELSLRAAIHMALAQGTVQAAQPMLPIIVKQMPRLDPPPAEDKRQRKRMLERQARKAQRRHK